jgi:hypothetical protein
VKWEGRKKHRKKEGPGLGRGVPKINRKGGAERIGVGAQVCPYKE